MAKEFESLCEGFRYDQWANRRWMEFLASSGAGDPDLGIMRHVLAAQEVWLKRCEGESLTAMPEEELSEVNLSRLNEAWLKVLTDRTDDPVIPYHRTTGEPGEQRLSQIAHHVIDHGAYHRGELRGLCRARDNSDFPETGLIGFYILQGQTG